MNNRCTTPEGSGGPVRVAALPGVRPAAVPVLRGWLGTSRVTVGATEPDGRVAVQLTGPSALVVAAEVAGSGRRLEVLDPPEARAHLAALAGELTSLYRDQQEDGALAVGSERDRRTPASPAVLT